MPAANWWKAFNQKFLPQMEAAKPKLSTLQRAAQRNPHHDYGIRWDIGRPYEILALVHAVSYTALPTKICANNLFVRDNAPQHI
jgi:hypothetical protein